VDEVIAQLLVTEGFATVEDVAYVDASEVAAIEGFDEETAEEIQASARDHLEREAAELDALRRELGVEDGLLEIEGVTLPVAVALGEGEVKSVERPRPAWCRTTSGGTTRNGRTRVRAGRPGVPSASTPKTPRP
jgi:N utilization substance protein A